MPCAQEVAEDAEALILKHFTTWDADAWQHEGSFSHVFPLFPLISMRVCC